VSVAILDTTFRQILDTIPDGVCVTTDQREIIYWSAGAERITGYRADEVVGMHCCNSLLIHTTLEGEPMCFDGCPPQDCVEYGSERTVSEAFIRRKDGERLAVYLKTSTLKDEGLRLRVEVFGELRDVAGEELTLRVQALSDSSITDPLSGLFNRRYFDAALEQSFAMYSRLGRRYGLLYLDVDNFKAINDSLGHAGGDDAIKFVADVLSSNARAMDVTARYGGDEFTVIAPVSTQEELMRYGERIVRLIHDSRLHVAADAGIPLTLSVGGTLVSEDDRDAHTTLNRADSAMYEAKHSGRDRLVIRMQD
jgi:diguanylate cyclase (GGDEF)-like protein/PAS domain S-box-containing protein